MPALLEPQMTVAATAFPALCASKNSRLILVCGPRRAMATSLAVGAPMLEMIIFAAAANAGTVAVPSQPTDFGVRALGGAQRQAATAATYPAGRVDLQRAVSVGGQWGRVTSTARSAARNRAVGGVRNSYHLVGRAIDIARRAGVSHRQIEAAYRNAGFTLVESLDEGDHSHFAFGTAGPRLSVASSSSASAGGTSWRVVTAPRASAR